MNFLKKLSLTFTSTAARKEYETLSRAQFIKFVRIFLLLMAAYGAYSIFRFFKAKDKFGGYGMIAWTVVLLLLWKFCGKLEKIISLLVIVLTVPILIPALIRLNSILQLSPVHFYPFFAGYFLGFLDRIVTLRLPGYLYKTGYTIASFLTRGIIFGKIMLPYLIAHSLIILIGLLLDLLKVREDQKMFQSFYDYREELIKFRTLMVSGLPCEIIILSKDLKQQLFFNERFQLLLDRQTNAEQDINQRIPDVLSHIHIDKNNLNPVTKLILDSHCESSQPLSIFEFLQTLTEHSLLQDQTQKIVFTASLQAPSDRRVFEASTFSLLWDSQDAVALILTDVTIQHQNLALKIADANKDKMLALISHELRTPLNGILGVVQLLEKGTNDFQTLQHLKVCKASGQLLLNLVNSILDLQHIRDNKFSLKITRVNLNELLHEVFDLFKFQFEQKQLKFAMSIPQDLPLSFSTDQNRLKQIMINLIGNALKFTFEGGVEVTATKSTSEYIELRVTDTGTGIKEEDQSKLFKMYGRLDQESPQTNTQGVGFGLEISNQLAKLLCEGDEGGIKFESQVEKGTTFHFFIKESTTSNPEIPNRAKSKKEKKASPRNDLEEVEMEILNTDELLISKDDKSNDLSHKISLYSMQALSKFHLESVVNTPHNRLIERSKMRNSHLLLGHTVSASTRGCAKDSNNAEIQLSEPSEVHSFRQATERLTRINTSQKKPQILIVDDNPFNLLVARHLAENLGYATSSALNGKIAVEMLQNNEQAYCAVLMDLQMPVMDGYEATRILKKMMDNEEIAEIPIIALSANDSHDDKKRCQEIGMKDHISKPLDEKRLKKVLEEVMEEDDFSSGGSCEIQLTDVK